MEILKKGKCAPHLQNKNSKTCFSKESLVKISDELNLPTNGNKNKLWNNIREHFSNKCNEESCWINHLKTNDTEIKYNTFRPQKPEEWKKNKYTWLNTYDILFVMKQFEKYYTDFHFFGPVPLDCPISFNCELTKLNLDDIHKKQKINKLGIIYNHDKHYESGSHWTGIYINIPDKTIDYYDSYGTKPPKLIYEFMKKIGNNEYKLIYNDKRHQYGGSECGMYSMYFILQRLENITMKQISEKKISDNNMNKLRDILYRD